MSNATFCDQLQSGGGVRIRLRGYGPNEVYDARATYCRRSGCVQILVHARTTGLVSARLFFAGIASGEVEVPSLDEAATTNQEVPT